MVIFKLNEHFYELSLEKQADGGVDVKIDSYVNPYVCKFTPQGELLLYADVYNKFETTKNGKYIKVVREMDNGD